MLIRRFATRAFRTGGKMALEYPRQILFRNAGSIVRHHKEGIVIR